MTVGTERRRISGGARVRAAWTMWALTSVCALLAVALHERGSLIVLLPATAWAVTSSTVGVLIVRRRHENPIGWILCASAFFFAFGLSSGTYAVHALVTRPGSLPAGEVAAWLSAWTLEPVYLLFVYLFALFPDGHTLSRRGRLLLWIAGILMAAGIVVEAFGPGPVQADEPFRNPLGVEAAAGVFILVGGLVDLLTGLLLVLSVVSVYLRYRRAGGIERQQIKWLAYAASLLGAVAAVGTIDALLLDVFGWWMFLVLVAALFGIPLSIGAAVLRYRLYDIDLIINRTLVYAALTAVLALVYVGSVVVLQGGLRSLAGQGSQLAIVASTLIVAALFNPLRRRVQVLVDRRFYRGKYDAAKTLAAFNARLRDETDLHALSGDLVGTVRSTMQPSRVSLWLSPDATQKDGRRSALGEQGRGMAP